MISKETLKEWERLANEATEGPWVFHEGRIRHKALKQEKSFAARLSIPNGNFIAAAREAVPTLIAEVRRLNAITARLEREADWLAKRFNSCPVSVIGIAGMCVGVPKDDKQCVRCWRGAAQKAVSND